MLRVFRVGDQLVDRFAGKQLVLGQWSAPSASVCVAPGLARRSRISYRFAVPRASFFTLLFFEPRAYSRGFSGVSMARFLRAARLAFLRSSLLSFLVFAMSAFYASPDLSAR